MAKERDIKRAKKAGKKLRAVRTATQRAQDQAFIAEKVLKGWTDPMIHKALMSVRPYTLSVNTVSTDRRAMVQEWRKVSIDRIGESVQKQLARIEMVEREAWEEWEKSKKPAVTTKEEQRLREFVQGGEVEHRLVVDAITTLTETGTGDKHWLQVILGCVDRRAKLLGQYTDKHIIEGKIEQERTVNVKMFHTVNPFMWDDPRIAVVDGEVLRDGNVVDLLPEGDDN